ncbi:flagellar hook-basal body complex protein FliE [Tardiphaga sp.]|uniref:flagellar hook-basal body complex protein FliE n=1 Tax=Tardiphaga sp. TaxID=1926292 RepID=UPI00352BC20F
MDNFALGHSTTFSQRRAVPAFFKPITDIMVNHFLTKMGQAAPAFYQECVTMNDMSVANVMALRTAILDRQTALRNLAPAPANPVQSVGETTKTSPTSFAATLETAVQKVNGDLEREDTVTEAYERGDITDIATVALMQARASVSFETTLQVRNKLLSAYQDIMRMQV